MWTRIQSCFPQSSPGSSWSSRYQCNLAGGLLPVLLQVKVTEAPSMTGSSNPESWGLLGTPAKKETDKIRAVERAAWWVSLSYCKCFQRFMISSSKTPQSVWNSLSFRSTNWWGLMFLQSSFLLGRGQDASLALLSSVPSFVALNKS